MWLNDGRGCLFGLCHVTGNGVDPGQETAVRLHDPKGWMGKHVTGNGVDPVLTSYAGECHVTVMRPDEGNHVTGRCADPV